MSNHKEHKAERSEALCQQGHKGLWMPCHAERHAGFNHKEHKEHKGFAVNRDGDTNERSREVAIH